MESTTGRSDGEPRRNQRPHADGIVDNLEFKHVIDNETQQKKNEPSHSRIKYTFESEQTKLRLRRTAFIHEGTQFEFEGTARALRSPFTSFYGSFI